MNILGENKKPEYLTVEPFRKLISLPFLIALAVNSLNNSYYVEYIFKIMMECNIFSITIIKIIIAIFIAYPWINACYFIGQYTRKLLLNVMFMAPITKGTIITHFTLSLFLIGVMNTYPSVTNLFYEFVFNFSKQNETLVNCKEDFFEHLEHEMETCSAEKPLNYPMYCYGKEIGLGEPYYQVFTDWFDILSGTIVTFILMRLSIKRYTFMYMALMMVYLISTGVAMIFGHTRKEYIDIVHRKFLFFKKNLNTEERYKNLYSMLIFESCSLLLATPVLIMIGSELPVTTKPSVIAVATAISQNLFVLYVYYTFFFNLSVLSYIYQVPIDCLYARNMQLYLVMFASYNAALPNVYEDQGILSSVVQIILLRSFELFHLALHGLAILQTVRQAYPITEFNKGINIFIVFVISLLINVSSQIGTMSFGESHYYVLIYATVIAMFLAVAYSICIFIIYGTRRLNSDLLFFHGYHVSPLSNTLSTLLPYIMIGLFLKRFIIFLKQDNSSFTMRYQDCGIPDLIPYYVPVLGTIGIVLLTSVVIMLQALGKRDISKAFLPTEYWGPWSPQGYNKRIIRENFHPETAVRFEGNYYACTHHCWLRTTIIPAEIAECERNYEEFRSLMKEVDLKTIEPYIYTRYRRVIDSMVYNK